MRVLPTLTAVLLLSACLSSTEPDMRWADPETIEYAAELNVNLEEMEKRDSGLYVLDLVLGDGEEPAANSNVTVFYTGWFPNGVAFDGTSSQPVEFGLNRVIEGWQEGILDMREGGKRQLVVPPALAYGSTGFQVIPPFATLVFEIELVGVN